MVIHNKMTARKAEKEPSEGDSEQNQLVEGAESDRHPRILGERWDGRDTFTVEEAGCAILRLSRAAAYAAAETGKLPVIRIGRRLLVPRHALERLLAGAVQSGSVA